jgi:hypothetical protein
MLGRSSITLPASRVVGLGWVSSPSYANAHQMARTHCVKNRTLVLCAAKLAYGRKAIKFEDFMLLGTLNRQSRSLGQKEGACSLSGLSIRADIPSADLPYRQWEVPEAPDIRDLTQFLAFLSVKP